MASCLRLLAHCVRFAASRTFCTAGTSRAMRMAMMAITTSSSIKVKAQRLRRMVPSCSATQEEVHADGLIIDPLLTPRKGQPLRSFLLAAPEQTGARVEDLAADRLGGGGVAVLVLEVGEVRLAVGAIDHLEVKSQVRLERRIERVEEIAAELLARGTAEAMAAPDGAERMLAAILLAQELPQLLAQRLRRTQLALDVRRLRLAEAVFEVGAQDLRSDQGHASSCANSGKT